jgi:DNA-binding GntR family transcriptional regulator
MKRDHRTMSIAEQIFEKLEQDILSGKYKRGDVLCELKLSSEFGVSRTPIREALRRLEQECIVEDKGRGIVVIGISREDILDMYEIRIRIEGLAAARACRNRTDAQLNRMKEILDLQSFYIERKHSSDTDEIVESIKNLDSEFHEMLYVCSGSRVYEDTLSQIHRKMIKYRRTSMRKHSRAKQSQKEHYAIYQAIKKQDEKLAYELTSKHVTNARDNITNGGVE